MAAGKPNPTSNRSAALEAAVKNALSYVSQGEIPKLRLPATNEEVLKHLTEFASKTKATASGRR